MSAEKLLSIPTKKSETVPFAGKLLAFLHSNYPADSGNFTFALDEFVQLRDKCVVKPMEPNDFNLKALMRFEALMRMFINPQVLRTAPLVAQTISNCDGRSWLLVRFLFLQASKPEVV